MSFRACKDCDQFEEYCECQNPDIRNYSDNGDEIKPRDENDKGGFLGQGFEYCPGDPYW